MPVPRFSGAEFFPIVGAGRRSAGWRPGAASHSAPPPPPTVTTAGPASPAQPASFRTARPTSSRVSPESQIPRPRRPPRYPSTAPHAPGVGRSTTNPRTAAFAIPGLSDESGSRRQDRPPRTQQAWLTPAPRSAACPRTPTDQRDSPTPTPERGGLRARPPGRNGDATRSAPPADTLHPSRSGRRESNSRNQFGSNKTIVPDDLGRPRIMPLTCPFVSDSSRLIPGSAG